MHFVWDLNGNFYGCAPEFLRRQRSHSRQPIKTHNTTHNSLCDDLIIRRDTKINNNACFPLSLSLPPAAWPGRPAGNCSPTATTRQGDIQATEYSSYNVEVYMVRRIVYRVLSCWKLGPVSLRRLG